MNYRIGVVIVLSVMCILFFVQSQPTDKTEMFSAAEKEYHQQALEHLLTFIPEEYKTHSDKNQLYTLMFLFYCTNTSIQGKGRNVICRRHFSQEEYRAEINREISLFTLSLDKDLNPFFIASHVEKTGLAERTHKAWDEYKKQDIPQYMESIKSK